MFSQLGPLFKTAFRQAESTDARLEIRREEKQDQGKKREHKEESAAEGDLWEDSTTVSVEALKTFLIEFLKSKGQETEEERRSVEKAPSAYTPAPLQATTTMAARAMKAYGSHTLTPAPPPTEPRQTTDETVNLADLLAADELRAMHALIRELESLSRQGLQTLTIEKQDTFLGALVTAVEQAKSSA